MSAPEPGPDHGHGAGPAPGARLRDLTGQPELLVAMAIMVAFIFLASLQVVTRYVFNAPLVWTEELSATLLIWLTFLGAAAIERENGHVRLQTVDEILPEWAARKLYALYDLFILFWLGCLIYAGVALVRQLDFEMTPALRIPYRYVMLVVPLAAALMSLYVARSLLRNLGLWKRGDGG